MNLPISWRSYLNVNHVNWTHKLHVIMTKIHLFVSPKYIIRNAAICRAFSDLMVGASLFA